jgi:hypothetical protein
MALQLGDILSPNEYDERMTTQVQIRLSDAELAVLDDLAVNSTRSDVLRAGLVALARERERSRIDEAYATEYRRVPDTPDEMRTAESNLAALLDGDDW